jgi:hypothetical protein
MTNEEFISRIRKAVYEPAVKGSLTILEHPPGRRPSRALVELSQWFNRLSPEDKEGVRGTIQLAARAAVFGMLAVLDGVTAIREAGEEAGTLELRHSAGGQWVVLNDPGAEPLHDLFAGEVPPP